jgi:hypothetical protein
LLTLARAGLIAVLGVLFEDGEGGERRDRFSRGLAQLERIYVRGEHG